MPDSEFDLTIIGGGIVGAMTAWQALRRRPEWQVLWLDRSIFGLGASGYAGAMLTPFGRSAAHSKLLGESFRLLPELSRDIGPLPVRELTGWYVASPALAEERRSWFIEDTPGVASQAQQEEIQRFLPQLTLDGRTILGPFRVRQGRPGDFITRISALCRQNSQFSIWEGVQMKTWHPDSDGVRLMLTGAPEIKTRFLALTTGPWATHQVAGDNALSSMRVKRVAACHFEVTPSEDAPVLYLGDHDSFLLPIPADCRWLFGFPSAAWDIEPKDFRSEMDDHDRALADSIVAEYSPVLARYRRGGRAFYDCYREDLMPVATCVAGDCKVVFAGACAGSGFRFSLSLAQRVLDLLESR